MDINQVKFGSYSIGTSFNGTQKKESKEAGETQVGVNQQNQTKQMDVDGMFDAMNIQGEFYKSQINKTEPKLLSSTNLSWDEAVALATDKLGAQRASEIDAVMINEYEPGVNEVANTIEAEFPGVFADSQKFALAAQTFAKG